MLDDRRRQRNIFFLEKKEEKNPNIYSKRSRFLWLLRPRKCKAEANFGLNMQMANFNFTVFSLKSFLVTNETVRYITKKYLLELDIFQ